MVLREIINFNATLARFKLTAGGFLAGVTFDFNATLARFKPYLCFSASSKYLHFNATLARFKLAPLQK